MRLPEQQQNQGNHNFATQATSLYDTATSRTNPLAAQFTGHNAANMFLGLANYSNQFVRGSFLYAGAGVRDVLPGQLQGLVRA